MKGTYSPLKPLKVATIPIRRLTTSHTRRHPMPAHRHSQSELIEERERAQSQDLDGRKSEIMWRYWARIDEPVPRSQVQAKIQAMILALGLTPMDLIAYLEGN